MRQRLFAAAAAFMLLTAAAPMGAYAATPKAEDEALILKKKKKEAAQKKAAEEKRKAAEVKKREELKKQAAAKKEAEARKRLAAKKELEKLKAADLAERRKARLKAEADLRKRRAERLAARRDCGSAFQCMFSNRRTTRSTGFATSSAFSRQTTKKVVAFNEGKYAPGTLIVRTPERALYYVLGDGEAIRYSVGVGKEGFQWSGSSRIVSKREWPEWRPPQQMIEREAAKGHILPAVMEGGPQNPLGARAMYIGGTLFRVHGTNNAASIGGAVSSGCIRMMNADVIDLYDRVKIGARIYVYQ
jgi:lipoprotein-anchoring transpeptidase ErfK/SrfK